MSNEVRSLEPSAVWNHFADLNAVPRPSKHEERVIEFMVQFGHSLDLPTRTDAVGNVFITKPATPGMEHRTPVVLQAHYIPIINGLVIDHGISTEIIDNNIRCIS